MLLSEMFGVERDTDFMVKGHSRTFRIMENSLYGHESIYVKTNRGSWVGLEVPTIMSMIDAGPDCIIHLPPPLTDEQREQLRALYTLTFRWIVKNKKGAVIAYSHKPYRYDEYWATEKVDANIQSVAKELSVCSLVSWSDPEPYGIGKALGVEG